MNSPLLHLPAHFSLPRDFHFQTFFLNRLILPPKPQVEPISEDPTQEVTQEVSSELSPEIQAHFDDLRNIDISGLNALDLDFGSIFIKSWKVKVKFGLVYDFSDFKTLQRYMKEGKVVQN